MAKILKRLGLSAEEFAARMVQLGYPVAPRTVYRWLSGDNHPQPSHWSGIEALLLRKRLTMPVSTTPGCAPWPATAEPVVVLNAARCAADRLEREFGVSTCLVPDDADTALTALRSNAATTSSAVDAMRILWGQVAWWLAEHAAEFLKSGTEPHFGPAQQVIKSGQRSPRSRRWASKRPV